MQKRKIVIEKVSVEECGQSTGLVVVIDVLRAFTTAAAAFSKGAEKIIAAFSLRDRNPEFLIMGEINGIPIEGFDFSNSPHEIIKQDLTGKTLVHRTTAGTQGIAKAVNAEFILPASFVIAEATFKRMLQLMEGKVTFVITGKRSGIEDLALAEFLEARLLDRSPDPEPYLEKARSSPSGRLFASNLHPAFPKEDLAIATEIDKFPFAMQVDRENGLSIIRKVDL